MQIKTFRAKNIQEALKQIRLELGPDASVLHTREVRRGLLGRMMMSRQIEVAASNDVNVQPSQALTNANHQANLQPTSSAKITASQNNASAAAENRSSEPVYEKNDRDRLQAEMQEIRSMVEELRRSSPPRHHHSHSDDSHSESGPRENDYSTVLSQLLDAGVPQKVARECMAAVCGNSAATETADTIRRQVVAYVEDALQIGSPLQLQSGKCTVAAFVGPTGVGKTTTIAKLAAIHRLHKKQRVGLLTVDTYRIAAVEQLRTYASIVALPMEVVATPREMRQAIERMADLDLVLIDTAGRSPRDDVQLQELQSMLAEAKPDETMLVLSCVSSSENLQAASRRFAEVGANRLVFTKLDEAIRLGNLLPALQTNQLPVSYVTDGQNVPDDIQESDVRFLTEAILGEPFFAAHRTIAA